MIKRELKYNLKNFIIWTSVLIGIFLVVYLIYPLIITDETVKNLDEMMKIFPEDMLKAFNMDITSISSAYGWLKTEGFMFVLLIVGIYSSTMGLNIVLKEENDKTIEYLSSLPIKRNKVLTNKIVVALFYIILMIILLGIFNYIALIITEKFNHKEFILLSLTPILIAVPLFSINLFLSMFFHKTNKTLGISLGMVFVFYILNVLSEISKNVEFLKYFSIYTLADTRNVITKAKINPIMLIITAAISIVFITLSYVKYNKKELI